SASPVPTTGWNGTRREYRGQAAKCSEVLLIRPNQLEVNQSSTTRIQSCQENVTGRLSESRADAGGQVPLAALSFFPPGHSIGGPTMTSPPVCLLSSHRHREATFCLPGSSGTSPHPCGGQAGEVPARW